MAAESCIPLSINPPAKTTTRPQPPTPCNKKRQTHEGNCTGVGAKKNVDVGENLHFSHLSWLQNPDSIRAPFHVHNLSNKTNSKNPEGNEMDVDGDGSGWRRGAEVNLEEHQPIPRMDPVGIGVGANTKSRNVMVTWFGGRRWWWLRWWWVGHDS